MGVETGAAAVKPITLFYSYSHRDEEFRRALETHLAFLRRSGLIAEWHDRMIGAGGDWKGDIDRNLASADIVLLLVSADFIASDYCWGEEMTKALQRHHRGEARVVPVILRPCRWLSTPLAKVQAVPRDGKAVTAWLNRDAAFDDVAAEVERIIDELRQDRLRAAEDARRQAESERLRAEAAMARKAEKQSRRAEDEARRQEEEERQRREREAAEARRAAAERQRQEIVEKAAQRKAAEERTGADDAGGGTTRPPSKPLRWWLIGGALLLLVAAGVGAVLVGRESGEHTAAVAVKPPTPAATPTSAVTEKPPVPAADPKPAPPPQKPALKPGDTFVDCEKCPEMVVIAGGTFAMGSPAKEEGRFNDEGPQRQVTIGPFAIGETEVTFDQWDACVAAGGCNGYRPNDNDWVGALGR